MSVTIQRPPPPPARWTASRVAGYLAVGGWIFAGGAALIYFVGSWDAELIKRYAPNYWSGLQVTLSLVSLSLLLGAVLSFPLAWARGSANRWVCWLAYAYVYFFRGTPLLAQTFLIYYGLGSFRGAFETLGLWWFFREAWYCALLAFTLNTAAYQAEILRGAVAGVARGQWEGAASLGLSRRQTFLKIIMPQALIIALRPYANEIILMIKGSAIVAVITVYDLMGETRRAFSRSFDFQTYIWAAIIYLLIVEALRIATELAEARLTRHLGR